MSEKKKVVAKNKYPQTMYVTLYNGEIDSTYTKNDLADCDTMEVGEYVFKQSGKVKSSVSVEIV